MVESFKISLKCIAFFAIIQRKISYKSAFWFSFSTLCFTYTRPLYDQIPIFGGSPGAATLSGWVHPLNANNTYIYNMIKLNQIFHSNLLQSIFLRSLINCLSLLPALCISVPPPAEWPPSPPQPLTTTPLVGNMKAATVFLR